MALHCGAIGQGFVNWDDNRFITANPLFSAGGWSYVRAALTQIQFDAYHPLHLLSYLPDRWLWPQSPAGFHAVGLALLAIDVYLLFLLARRHAGPVSAALAVLLFAAHPLCVEPIHWISARKDLLALAFFVGVFLVEDGRDAADVRFHLAGPVLFVAALLAKTSTLCLPPLLVGWLIWMRGAALRTALVRAAPYAVLAVVPTVAVVTVWRSHAMIPLRPTAAPVDVLATFATYARRTLWPSDLGAIYPETMPQPVLSAAVALVVSLAVVFGWRRLSPGARFAVVAFPIALLPVANVVPVVFRFADRYAFLALAMLVPPLAAGLQWLFDARGARRSIAMVVVAAVSIGLVVTGHRLAASWNDSRALWAHATAVHPDALMARLKYAETLREERDWLPAVAEYQTAIRLQPDNPLGYAGLFYLYATRAEAQGRLARGTAGAWLAELGTAMGDRSVFDALLAKVPHAACSECADSLLLLNLRCWPASDGALLRSARAALDRGMPDQAFVFLGVAADQQSTAWTSLFAESRRASAR
jgi:protein O-mannosyl-transferase